MRWFIFPRLHLRQRRSPSALQHRPRRMIEPISRHARPRNLRDRTSSQRAVLTAITAAKLRSCATPSSVRNIAGRAGAGRGARRIAEIRCVGTPLISGTRRPRVPGGSWTRYETDCRETLRQHTVDFCDTQTDGSCSFILFQRQAAHVAVVTMGVCARAELLAPTVIGAK